MTRRLNAGCWDVLLAGYLNLDCQIAPRVASGEVQGEFLQHDVREGLPAEDASVVEVRGDQFLEHLELPELVAFLRECRRVLVPGGEARFTFPDMGAFAAACDRGEMETWLDQFPVPPVEGVPRSLQALNCIARETWGHRLCLTAWTVAHLLDTLGFVIVEQRIERLNGVVVAREP